MANEYSDRATLKLALSITDTARDSLLDKALTASSRAIDRQTGRRFWLDASASARVFNPHGRIVRDDRGELFLIDDLGAAGALVVEVGTPGSWTPITDYETWPDNALANGQPITGLLLPTGYWGTDRTRVRVTERWGWPVIPDEIEHATRLQAGRLYRRKDSPEGVAGSAEWGLVRVPRLDPDVLALIEPYTLPGFA
ncbi:hypothetical protein ACQEVF_59520 [Nonomuraea polychroma]|uniref:hypothetical protein n=1 Tax=Nonomuraea polychroma TaxID=46176 RepID=UPI003D91675C